jgi:hypothetical protein
MFTSAVSIWMLSKLGLGRELTTSIVGYLEPPAIGLSPTRLKLLVKDPNNLVSTRMLSTLFVRMARTDGVKANPAPANATRDALARAASTINKIRHCSDPCLSFRIGAANNVLSVTSWTLSENLMMIAGDAHGHGPYPITNGERTLLSAWLKQGRGWLML